MMQKCALAGVFVVGALIGCGGGGGGGGSSEPPRTANEARVSGEARAGGEVGAGQSAEVSHEEAERCLVRGRAELSAKHYAEAEARLRLAWEGDSRAEIAADLGRVELALNKIGEAAAHFSAALDGGISGVEAELAGLRPKLGSIALKAPSSDRDIAVYIDGWRATHRAPKLELWLTPGRHDLELRAGLRIVARKAINIEIGQRVDWDANVDGRVDLQVDVDAEARALARLRAALGAGVGAVGANVGAVGAELNAKAPSVSGSLSTPLIVVGGIAGAAALAIGIGLSVAATDLGSDIGKLSADLPTPDVDLDPCEGSNRAANSAACLAIDAKVKDQEIFLGVGVPLLVTTGLVVGGLIAYVAWPRAKVPDAKVEFCGVTVRPGVGPGSFALQGSF
jgi:hypothetical protein